MGYIVERKITIARKYNSCLYEEVNKGKLGDYPKICNGSLTAVNRLTANSSEMRKIMPVVLGQDASNNQNFVNACQEYLHNWKVEVRPNGYDLDISLDFSFYDEDELKEIKEYCKKHNLDISKESVVANHIVKNVKEEELYKYSRPVNIEDYLGYRLCLNTRRVANSKADVKKSTEIVFWLNDKKQEAEVEKQNKRAEREIAMALGQLLGETNRSNVIRNILLVMTPEDRINIMAMTDEELDFAALDMSKVKPEKMFNTYKLPNLKDLATIVKLWAAGIINREDELFYDSKDKQIVFGGSIESAAIYLNNPEKIDYKQKLIDTYKVMFKQNV